MKKQELSELLLKWYNAHGRTLPWRVKGGAHPDPYVVLVSEFMLQQTTVKTVLDYFPEFLKRFPTAESLAAADLEEVYRYWQGLGYYTRARSLYATAQTVVNEFGGKFPQNREEVLKLKGIGAYTAAMGGVDAIVFTGGIGENGSEVRKLICERLAFMGIELDEEANKLRGTLTEISKPGSKVRVFVIPTNEELVIAQDVKKLI